MSSFKIKRFKALATTNTSPLPPARKLTMLKSGWSRLINIDQARVGRGEGYEIKLIY